MAPWGDISMFLGLHRKWAQRLQIFLFCLLLVLLVIFLDGSNKFASLFLTSLSHTKVRGYRSVHVRDGHYVGSLPLQTLSLGGHSQLDAAMATHPLSELSRGTDEQHVHSSMAFVVITLGSALTFAVFMAYIVKRSPLRTSARHLRTGSQTKLTLVLQATNTPEADHAAHRDTPFNNFSAAALDIQNILQGIASSLTTDKEYVAKARKEGRLDELGFPLAYDPLLIQAYFEQRPKKLQYRLDQFLSVAVPFFRQIATIALAGGEEALKENSGPLARQACEAFETLGPTYIKAGQVLSVRPDLLPPAALVELTQLQDSVPTFSTQSALRSIEAELRQPLAAVFTDISRKPAAAASLAQVYKARMIKGGLVAVKIQRPEALENVSLDLYILRGAAKAYQVLAQQIIGKEDADFVKLFDEWAEQFYLELDFAHEAANQAKLRELLQGQGMQEVYVPAVIRSSRKLMISEWVDARKLSDCSPEELRELTPVGRECFLTQLLQVGFLHGDPHPGNILKLKDSSKGKLAIVDCGCMITIEPEERDAMVSAIIHVANQNYSLLVQDLIALKALPPDCNPIIVGELLRRTLGPYLVGGGLQQYRQGLIEVYLNGNRTSMGALQAILSDLWLAFSTLGLPPMPPHLIALARSLVTLEGIALQGDSHYSIISQAYPFVAQRLIRDQSARLQQVLIDTLYSDDSSGPAQTKVDKVAWLLRAALWESGHSDVPFEMEGANDTTMLEPLFHYILSPGAEKVRALLEDEAVKGVDLLARQAVRRGIPSYLLHMDDAIPASSTLQFLLPPALIDTVESMRRPLSLLDSAVPPLTQSEESYAIALVDLTARIFGRDAAALASGDWLGDLRTPARILLAALAGGQIPGFGGDEVTIVSAWLQQNIVMGDEARRTHALQSLSDSLLGATRGTPDMPINFDIATIAQQIQTTLQHDTDMSQFEEQKILISTWQALSDEERAELQQLSQRVVDRVVEEWRFRLQPVIAAMNLQLQPRQAIAS